MQNLAKYSWVSIAFFAYSPSKWSMKSRLQRFLAMGHRQNLPNTFDSHLDLESSAVFFKCEIDELLIS